MVGHVALDHGIGVRIPASQPTFTAALPPAGTRRARSTETGHQPRSRQDCGRSGSRLGLENIRGVIGSARLARSSTCARRNGPEEVRDGR